MTLPVSVELTDYELILLINTLGNYITEKAHSGMDTNDLPETKLRLKLMQATNRPRPV